MPFEFMQKGAKSETFEFADRFMVISKEIHVGNGSKKASVP
jgi:hypothetical protein